MDSSTKESLYSLLNLIDYLESVSFISLDVNKVNQIRESIFSVINSNNNVKKISSGNEYQYDFTKLIVDFFTSKKLFKTKEEIVNYLENNFKIKNAKKWEKKTVNDIIGNVVVFISSQDEEYFNHIVNEMNDKIKNLDISSKNKKSNSLNKNTFVSTWFNYFEKYR
ncbi:MAG: hypothetical protein D8H95_03265 [Lachnospiraceae bacterium]|jgi:hypothetical protein|nr:MAG: hypothetical protein D8H95_03265 [Lachnospiraceae bacterium]